MATEDVEDPVEVEHPRPDDGPSLWTMNAYGTRYRGMVVPVGPEAAPLFGMEVDRIVMVEPAGVTEGRARRLWAPFSSDRTSPLVQEYVEAKFFVRGEDAKALTILVAAMLGRTPIMEDE